MTDYTKATNFATKDALVTGDPLKVVKGTEIDDEFNAIEDSIETKADLASPTFTGIPKAPTAPSGTNTTQLATTAFVKTELTTISIGTDELEDGSVTQAKLADNSVGSAQIIDNNVTADELDVSGDGTAGQFLISDGDGSFSWTAISVLSAAASDPTTRDDGTSLAEGDQYYNTADDQTKTYDGTSWNSTANLVESDGTVPVGGIIKASAINHDPITSISGQRKGKPLGYQFTCSSGGDWLRVHDVTWDATSQDYDPVWDDSYSDNGSYTLIDYGTWALIGLSLFQRVA